MHSRLNWLLAVVALALLGACGPVYETQYDFIAPMTPEGRQCVSQCNEISNLCRQNCDLKDERCMADAHQRAAWEYERYVKDRTAQKLPIEKNVNDFLYTSGCYTASSCKGGCDQSYRQCFTGCGGQVTSKVVCTAFCD